MAHLLHALNQPLTGLQCSLELAVAGPRSAPDYVRTLREGLELTCRMRVLVEALRELAEAQLSSAEKLAVFHLDRLLSETADELQPVADENGIELQLATGVPLPVCADRDRLAGVLFRCLESALSLSAKQSNLQVAAAAEPSTACLTLGWTQETLPEYSPFSRQELGLLVAQAGWEQAGGAWSLVRTDNRLACILRFPLHVSTPVSRSKGHRQ
jgi:signal transduction histidine kinase